MYLVIPILWYQYTCEEKLSLSLNSFPVYFLNACYVSDTLMGTSLDSYFRSNHATQSLFYLKQHLYLCSSYACFKSFSPARAKGNMKSLKQSLQPCFSSTNIACCSHHRSDLAIDVVTFWNVFSESQYQKGSNNNEKSTKSSEQVVSFQKSLHQGIHFFQCPKNQLFGIIGHVWVFSRKNLGKPGKNVRLTLSLLFSALQ